MENDDLRILVPLDGSDGSESILSALVPLVQGRPAELVLLGIVDSFWESTRARSYFDRLRKRLLIDGVRATSKLEAGGRETEILHWARERGCSMIAMSTHGRSGLSRALMGSVTEDVLRNSEMPLIVTRPGSRVGDWKRIVVALDGSETAETILPDAEGLAKPAGATLHLLGVKPPPVVTAFSGYGEYDDPRPYIDGIARRKEAEGVLTLPVVRHGDPADEIVRYAREAGAGLVGITTHGRTGLARVFLGSVAEQVIRNAPCPVLVRRMASVPAATTSKRT